MANAFPITTVAAPARVAAPYGLFSVLTFRDEPDGRWQGGGVRWDAIDGTTPLGVVGAPQAPAENGAQTPLSGTPKTKRQSRTFDDKALPFTVYAYDSENPVGAGGSAAVSEAAREALESLEERTVESLLAGDISGMSPNFTGGTALAAASDPLDAIVALEVHLAETYGSRGILHLPRGFALRAFKSKALETRGNGLFTRLGTPVVAGQGYAEGTGFATSAMLGYRSDVFEATRVPYDLLDRASNDLHAIAERTYVIGFDDAVLASIDLTPTP